MVIDRITQFPPERIALQTFDSALTYGELISQVNQLTDWLILNKINSVVLFGENKPNWVIIDLACQSANIIFTPIPAFFSIQQIKHLIESVKPSLLFADDKFPLKTITSKEVIVSPISE